MNNGQGIPVDPQEVINQLIHRISNLTMELAVKDAYIDLLEKEKHDVKEEAI